MGYLLSIKKENYSINHSKLLKLSCSYLFICLPFLANHFPQGLRPLISSTQGVTASFCKVSGPQQRRTLWEHYLVIKMSYGLAPVHPVSKSRGGGYPERDIQSSSRSSSRAALLLQCSIHLTSPIPKEYLWYCIVVANVAKGNAILFARRAKKPLAKAEALEKLARVASLTFSLLERKTNSAM